MIGYHEAMSTIDDLCASDEAGLALTLITSRQTILPKRLIAPGPNEAQIGHLFKAAASAPDHGTMVPWRFVLIPDNRRCALADVFAHALRERDAMATDSQIAQAREKAFRAPFLAMAIARLGPDESGIDPLERMVSVGAAIQNILLCAHGMGFGSSVTSGQAMNVPAMRQLFSLQEGEQAVCFVSVGTVSQSRPARVRPDASSFVSSL